MTESKKTVIVKKDETVKDDIEKEIEDVVKDFKEEEKPVVETKKSTKTKKTETFAEKSADAAAAAALKVAINANAEIAQKEAEKIYFIEKKNHMLSRCKNDAKVTRTVSKFFAPYLGKVYTFSYNGIPVTIYCDGKPHEYPAFIAEKIDKKLAKIAESNTYKEIVDERLDQGEL